MRLKILLGTSILSLDHLLGELRSLCSANDFIEELNLILLSRFLESVNLWE